MIRAPRNRDSEPRSNGETCRKTRVLSIAPLVALLVCFSACTSTNPQTAYDHARQAYHRGDMATAADEAEKGYKEFHALSTEWAWKFVILRAKVLYWRGMNDEMLKLTASEPNPPLSGDLAVQKLRLEAVAHASSHRFIESEVELKQAESICTSFVYPSCGDLSTARGVLEMEAGRYPQAQDLFERALASARAAGDQFLEATELLNLSWSANAETHYDEALDWANAAGGIAVPQGFEGVAENALGNMGWAYYKLGDPDKAEGMFIEAEKQSAKLGDLTSQVTWLQAAGYIYLDARKFDVSEQYYRESLALAQHTNRDDMIDSLTALAFVSEQVGKLDDAKGYAEEALSMARADNNRPGLVYPLLVQGRLAARQRDTTTAENTFREVARSADCPVFLKWEAERSLAQP